VSLRTGVVTTLRQRIRLRFILASAPAGGAVISAIAYVPPDDAGIAAWTAHGSTPVQMPTDTIAVAW
jgi:hypothetical protein